MSTGLKAGPLPEKSTWLKASTKSAGVGVGVDRENKAILGYVVAQAGVLREPDPRGEFDEKGLRSIMRLMKEKSSGTKVRFGHPTASGDSVGKFLGRARNPRMSSVTVQRDGRDVELKAVRADLYFSETAFEQNPNGNLGEYLMNLAEEDPTSFGSSVVMEAEEEWRLDNHGNQRLGDDGNPLPPLFRPFAIHASDVVDEGAAVDGILSAELPDGVVRQATQLLRQQFKGATREVVEARCLDWLKRYLTMEFGEPEFDAKAAAVERAERIKKAISR